MTEPACTIFISYARVNREFADRLAEDLSKHSIAVWIDRGKLQGGQEWTSEIQQAIEKCHTMLVIVSPAALESRYVRVEYQYAFAQGKCIIPLIYQQCDLPIPLQSLHGTDFTNRYDEPFTELLERLQQLASDQNMLSSRQTSGTHGAPPRHLWAIGFATALTMLLVAGLGTIFMLRAHGAPQHQPPAQLTATSVASGTATAAASASATSRASPSSHSPTSASSPGPGTSVPATHPGQTSTPTATSRPGVTNTPVATPTPTITPTPTPTRSPQ